VASALALALLLISSFKHEIGEDHTPFRWASHDFSVRLSKTRISTSLSCLCETNVSWSTRGIPLHTVGTPGIPP